MLYLLPAVLSFFDSVPADFFLTNDLDLAVTCMLILMLLIHLLIFYCSLSSCYYITNFSAMFLLNFSAFLSATMWLSLITFNVPATSQWKVTITFLSIVFYLAIVVFSTLVFILSSCCITVFSTMFLLIFFRLCWLRLHYNFVYGLRMTFCHLT